MPWRKPWALHSPERLKVRKIKKQQPAKTKHIPVFLRCREVVPHLGADAALQLQLQPDHVHLLHVAQLVEFRHLARHFVDGHLDGVHLRALLLHHLDALLQVREAGTRCQTWEK